MARSLNRVNAFLLLAASAATTAAQACSLQCKHQFCQHLSKRFVSPHTAVRQRRLTSAVWWTAGRC